MIATIDGDLIAYRCAATAEHDDDWIATSRMDKLMDDILRTTHADTYKLFISGGVNFRYSIFPEYKANRTQPKPRWLQMCKDYLVKEWEGVYTDGIEADDALAMNQTEDTIICANDKDMLQVPGKHYNFVKDLFLDVTPLDGLKSFYRNMMIGDTSDNIRGVDRIGKARAAKLIDPQDNEQDMFDIVREQYNDDERMLMNGKLMHLWRFEGDIWSNATNLFSNSVLNIQLEEEAQQLS